MSLMCLLTLLIDLIDLDSPENETQININIWVFLLKHPKKIRKKNKMALLTRRQKLAIRSLFITGIRDLSEKEALSIFFLSVTWSSSDV